MNYSDKLQEVAAKVAEIELPDDLARERRRLATAPVRVDCRSRTEVWPDGTLLFADGAVWPQGDSLRSRYPGQPPA